MEKLSKCTINARINSGVAVLWRLMTWWRVVNPKAGRSSEEGPKSCRILRNDILRATVPCSCGWCKTWILFPFQSKIGSRSFYKPKQHGPINFQESLLLRRVDQLRQAIILLPFPFPLSIVYFPLLPLPILPLNLLNLFPT